MKLLILGGTGRTGKWLVKQALHKGHQVNVLIGANREFDVEAFPFRDKNLKVFTGTPLNKESLTNAMQGCDAIVSALNISRTSDNPWAPLRTPENFLSDVAVNLIELAPKNNINRVVVLSAYGTNETRTLIPFWFRWMIENSAIGIAYKDHEKAEDKFKNSGLEYTVVRPVGLTNHPKDREVLMSTDLHTKHKITISRKNTAKSMLDIVEQKLFVGEMPTISEK
jgi:uncharacterized protein YbjT (DUF2867 family)